MDLLFQKALAEDASRYAMAQKDLGKEFLRLLGSGALSPETLERAPVEYITQLEQNSYYGLGGDLSRFAPDPRYAQGIIRVLEAIKGDAMNNASVVRAMSKSPLSEDLAFYVWRWNLARQPGTPRNSQGFRDPGNKLGQEVMYSLLRSPKVLADLSSWTPEQFKALSPATFAEVALAAPLDTPGLCALAQKEQIGSNAWMYVHDQFNLPLAYLVLYDPSRYQDFLGLQTDEMGVFLRRHEDRFAILIRLYGALPESRDRIETLVKGVYDKDWFTLARKHGEALSIYGHEAPLLAEFISQHTAPQVERGSSYYEDEFEFWDEPKRAPIINADDSLVAALLRGAAKGGATRIVEQGIAALGKRFNTRPPTSELLAVVLRHAKDRTPFLRYVPGSRTAAAPKVGASFPELGP